MDGRFSALPAYLAERARTTTLAGVPALIAHPDPGWHEQGAFPAPAPVVLWMHGRTVFKELDPGRYLRWVRAGIAACALDLPGHGQRDDADRRHQGSDATLRIAEQMAGELDAVLDALSAPRFNGAFDVRRAAIGGMSAGGMAALIRLCSDHRFACAAVEATAGDFTRVPAPGFAVPDRIARLNPIDHLEHWRPVPLLALHSEADAWVPVGAMRPFISQLRERYTSLGVDAALVELVTWPETGAPHEHMGFGRVSNDAKNTQADFLARHLTGTPARD